MNLSYPGNGHTPAVMTGGPPDHPARRPVPGGAPPGRHVASRAPVRTPVELDYRLRGLGAEPPPGQSHPMPLPGPAPASAPTDRRRRRRGPVLAKVAVLLILATVAVLLLQAFVVQPFSVPGNEMSPALQAGDRILVLKSGLLEGPIRAGQIVVFRAPRSLPCTIAAVGGGDLVLRVVALPGQTIWSVGQTIFVGGRALHEPGWYAKRSGQVGSTPIPATTLSPGQYYVLADNRAAGCDSRAFGPVPKSSIVGEGIAIVMRDGHAFFGTL